MVRTRKDLVGGLPRCLLEMVHARGDPASIQHWRSRLCWRLLQPGIEVRRWTVGESGADERGEAERGQKQAQKVGKHNHNTAECGRRVNAQQTGS